MHLSRDLPQQVHQLVQQKAAGKGGRLQCNIFNNTSKVMIRAMAIMVESTAMTIILVPKSPIHWTPCKLTYTPFLHMALLSCVQWIIKKKTTT
jgi:hypothetical protein